MSICNLAVDSFNMKASKYQHVNMLIKLTCQHISGKDHMSTCQHVNLADMSTYIWKRCVDISGWEKCFPNRKCVDF